MSWYNICVKAVSTPMTHMRTCSLFLFTLALLSPNWLLAQPRRNCGTMEHYNNMVKKDPIFQQRLLQIESFTKMRAKSGRPLNQIIRIPVVVHIVYHTPTENISTAQVQSQIDVLNKDFRRKNNDASNTDPRFQELTSDTRIEFVLANVDPYGNPTTGITRTPTAKMNFAAFSDEVKRRELGGTNPWPSTDYLNIWVCNLDMGVLGFAQFPGGRKDTDGVVIGYKYFGTMGTVVAPFNLGRTTTHEIGHWLNLRHIWGDGPCGNDGVADTPPAEGPHHGCLSSAESCGSPDMVQNFMDYTDDACMNFFTRGQRDRMRSLFVLGGARYSLLSSRGIQQPEVLACAPPYALHASELSSSSALLSWQAMNNADRYEVRMRRLPGGEWKSRTYHTNQAKVVRLYPCTDYEFSVLALCNGEKSNSAGPQSFSTLGCGNDLPVNLVAEAVSPRQAVVSWEPVSGAKTYEVQFIPKGTRRKRSLIAQRTRTLLDKLDPGSFYYVRVRAKTQQGYSPFSEVGSFRTPRHGGAGIPTAKTRN